MKLLGALGVVGVLLWLGVVLGLVGISIYGLVLAFKASIVLGLVAFVIEPAPLIFGAVMLIGGTNLPQLIVDALTK